MTPAVAIASSSGWAWKQTSVATASRPGSQAHRAGGPQLGDVVGVEAELEASTSSVC